MGHPLVVHPLRVHPLIAYHLNGIPFGDTPFDSTCSVACNLKQTSNLFGHPNSVIFNFFCMSCLLFLPLQLTNFKFCILYFQNAGGRGGGGYEI